MDHTTLEDQAGKVDREATRIRTEAQRLISTNQVRAHEKNDFTRTYSAFVMP